jgi:deoxyribose-phosphate aldolase
MNYSEELKRYPSAPTRSRVEELVAAAREAAPGNQNAQVYKLCYSAIDLTSLNGTDSDSRISQFTEKVVEFPRHFNNIPNVASICVYPSMVEVVGLTLGATPMAITSVCGGFPSSQTYLEVKALETAMAIENGADEIDVVINQGQITTGDYDRAAGEIEVLKQECGEVILKVIVESGALQTPALVWDASLLAMLAGADFVKTSTGKIPVAATPEAAVAMCLAIKAYHEKTGRKVGFKAAGGVSTAADSALYYTIVEQILGRGWLTSALFRIGASSLANNLLSAIEEREVKFF